ncbi:unnamed protein product, partial [Symbiodinium sp. KB8]
LVMVRVINAGSNTKRAFASVWEATPLFLLVGGVVTFATWRGSQMLMWEPTVKVNASKRSTELYADEDKAAEWTKSKEARGDWWHALDTTNRHVFGEDSEQKTWAGVDRGTEQSYKGAKEFAR